MSYNATDTWLCLEHILILWQKHLSGLLWVTIVTCSPASEVIINNAIEFWEVLISKNIKVLGSNSLILEWFLVHTHPTSDCCLESSFLFFCGFIMWWFKLLEGPACGLLSRVYHVWERSTWMWKDQKNKWWICEIHWGCIPCYSSSYGLQNPRRS